MTLFTALSPGSTQHLLPLHRRLSRRSPAKAKRRLDRASFLSRLFAPIRGHSRLFAVEKVSPGPWSRGPAFWFWLRQVSFVLLKLHAKGLQFSFARPAPPLFHSCSFVFIRGSTTSTLVLATQLRISDFGLLSALGFRPSGFFVP